MFGWAVFFTIIGILAVIFSFITNKDDVYKAGSTILTVVSIVLALHAYPSNSTAPSHIPTSGDQTAGYFEPQPPDDADPYDLENGPQITDPPTDTASENIQRVTQSIVGEISSEGQRNTYAFIAPITGIYRFYFERDSVNSDYTFLMRDSRGASIAERSASHSAGGVTVDLEAGQEYRIEVRHRRGSVGYKIAINTPNEISTVTNNAINGRITFTDQRNRYTFTAPVTGRYRFDFGRDNVNSDYTFRMWDSRNASLAERSASHSAGGITVDLEAGQVYRIEVRHRRGSVGYEITINTPNEISAVTNNVINGQITFTDQRNRYTFTAPTTGRYRFDFGRDSVNSDYTFRMWNSRDASIAERNASHSAGGIAVDLEAGQEYRIEVRHRRNSVAYTIEIHSE